MAFVLMIKALVMGVLEGVAETKKFNLFKLKFFCALLWAGTLKDQVYPWLLFGIVFLIDKALIDRKKYDD